MRRPLESRVALVTGASRGIGRASAAALAEAGAAVVLMARSQERLELLRDELEADGHVAVVACGDVTVPADVDHAVSLAHDRLGRVDVLVNNAAVIPRSRDLVDYPADEWRAVLEVNLVGAVAMMRRVLPGMIDRGSGVVINVSSIGGRSGARGRSAYRAAKAALINVTESVAAEVARDGIRVNCICPGGVSTEGLHGAFGDVDSEALMRPEEIAELVVFLSSDASSSISGTAVDAFGTTNSLFRT